MTVYFSAAYSDLFYDGWLPREETEAAGPLKAWTQKSTTFCWSKQVERPAQIQKEMKLIPTLRVGSNTHVWREGRNYYSLLWRLSTTLNNQKLSFREVTSTRGERLLWYIRAVMGSGSWGTLTYLKVKFHRGRKGCLLIWVSCYRLRDTHRAAWRIRVTEEESWCLEINL